MIKRTVSTPLALAALALLLTTAANSDVPGEETRQSKIMGSLMTRYRVHIEGPHPAEGGFKETYILRDTVKGGPAKAFTVDSLGRHNEMDFRKAIEKATQESLGLPDTKIAGNSIHDVTDPKGKVVLGRDKNGRYGIEFTPPAKGPNGKEIGAIRFTGQPRTIGVRIGKPGQEPSAPMIVTEISENEFKIRTPTRLEINTANDGTTVKKAATQ